MYFLFFLFLQYLLLLLPDEYGFSFHVDHRLGLRDKNPACSEGSKPSIGSGMHSLCTSPPEAELFEWTLICFHSFCYFEFRIPNTIQEQEAILHITLEGIEEPRALVPDKPHRPTIEYQYHIPKTVYQIPNTRYRIRTIKHRIPNTRYPFNSSLRLFVFVDNFETSEDLDLDLMVHRNE